MANEHNDRGDLVSRRAFLQRSAALGAAAVFVEGCGDGADMPAASGDPAGAGGGDGQGGTDASTSASSAGGEGLGAGGAGGEGGAEPTPSCEETEDNIEGPFYKAGAPDVADLVGEGLPGTRLHLEGQVLGADCAPLADATVDLWQADSEGVYDLEGFTLRGKVTTDAEGRYAFTTVVPGHYLNGAQYRPAHIHVKVSAEAHAALTTQLYFEGDPYNDIDPFIKASLVMTPVEDEDGLRATFDFVLAAADA